MTHTAPETPVECAWAGAVLYAATAPPCQAEQVSWLALVMWVFFGASGWWSGDAQQKLTQRNVGLTQAILSVMRICYSAHRGFCQCQGKSVVRYACCVDAGWCGASRMACVCIPDIIIVPVQFLVCAGLVYFVSSAALYAKDVGSPCLGRR